jgi:hypothetical protein
VGRWGYSNQQLRKTELASKTAEINHTPLSKELGLDAEHGERIDKDERVCELRIVCRYLFNRVESRKNVGPFWRSDSAANFVT